MVYFGCVLHFQNIDYYEVYQVTVSEEYQEKYLYLFLEKLIFLFLNVGFHLEFPGIWLLWNDLYYLQCSLKLCLLALFYQHKLNVQLLDHDFPVHSPTEGYLQILLQYSELEIFDNRSQCPLVGHHLQIIQQHEKY